MKKLLFVILCVILCVNITSCNREDEIVIGLNYEGSGALAPYGKALLWGAELAVGEINASGGIDGRQVRLEKADNRSTGAESAAAVLYLKSVKGADVILGPATSTLAKAALSAGADILIISPSATSDELTANTSNKRLFLRLCFSDSVQGAAMGKYASSLGFQKAAVIIDMSSDYSVGCATAFRSAFSGEIVFEGRFLSGETDFSALVTELAKTNFDCIYLPAYYTEAGLFIRQSREQGIDKTFLGGDAMDSPYLADVIGREEYRKNVIYTDHFSYDDPYFKSFAEKYRNRYGENPPAYSALAYDSVMLYCETLREIGAENIQIVEKYIFNTNSFQGVTGKITIKENGDCEKQPVFVSLVD